VEQREFAGTADGVGEAAGNLALLVTRSPRDGSENPWVLSLENDRSAADEQTVGNSYRDPNEYRSL
jgi:hypothetical protein